ncbi:D-alanine--D-alanine ligase [Desertihabitans brevis]|uniref:D-alanine--D-alanine ligase n=1 Tax=Desertihabitans brevis TaxID=2268447 RepID=A0A367YWU7_9ACTN|nr:D-alanine--D-alanine ligase [Desertihabitans brevis]RCK70373.1 D-alanine--D-alanine ligase [Desertihabitans brevis]
MSAPVIVLAGGLSHERDVSLRSGRRVAEQLQDAGVEVLEHDVDPQLISTLRSHPGSVVLPLLHGEAGEDGSLREVLDLLDVPYVGSTGAACRVAFDKSIATRVVAEAGIRTPRQVALPHEIFRELGAAALVRALGEQIGFPMMVKPSRSGSALGCTRVDQPGELSSAMVAAYAYGSVAVVETFVTGTEVAVGVVEGPDGPQALPAVEIRPESGVYDYAARYTAGETRFLCPAEISTEAAEACARMALDVHETLGLAHLSRTDIIVDEQGRPTFLETNVAPGLTPTSTVPIALEQAGLGLGPVLLQLVELARGRHRP